MKKIFLFSGLGASEKVFDELVLPTFQKVVVHWATVEKNEDLQHYAKKLSKQIKDENPLLLGVSFGGVVALEVSKQLMNATVVLVSSCRAYRHLPLIFRLFGKLKLHYLLPTKLLTHASPVTYWFFSATQSQHQQQLKKILEQTDRHFMKWAIGQLLCWKGDFTSSKKIFQLHGGKDKLLPLCQANEVIAEGG
ncbi:MAG: alpha/beta hydrolase, partial [Flammeovirgaceae bacterium]